MGAKNRSGVRVVRRGGRNVLVIDFWFTNKKGQRERCRRDASVQQRTAARAEAERLQRFAAEHGTVKASPAVPTFERFVEEQFEPLVMPSYSPATRERYARLLHKEGVVEQLGRVRLDAIGAREFRQLEAFVRERGVIPRQHLIIVRNVLKTAVEHGVIAAMPSLPKVQKQRSKLPSAPPSELVTRLLDATNERWLRVAIALAFYAGLRSGEVRALRVGDVELRSRVLHVRNALSDDELWTPKGRAERAIPVASALREVLAVATAGCKATDALVATDGRATVTVTGLGTVPTRQRLYKAFVALQRANGVERPWGFHSLRHAFGTHVLRNGGNVEAVRELMGHRDLETTSRYLHAIADDRKAAISTFDGQRVGNGPLH